MMDSDQESTSSSSSSSSFSSSSDNTKHSYNTIKASIVYNLLSRCVFIYIYVLFYREKYFYGQTPSYRISIK